MKFSEIVDPESELLLGDNCGWEMMLSIETRAMEGQARGVG